MKLEPQLEGPYCLVQMAYHGKSGRLQDIQTGDIVRVNKGGLRERVHVNDLKLFCLLRSDRIGEPLENNLVELGEWDAGWMIGGREFSLDEAR